MKRNLISRDSEGNRILVTPNNARKKSIIYTSDVKQRKTFSTLIEVANEFLAQNNEQPQALTP